MANFSIDLKSDSFVENPYPAYQKLRDAGGPVWNDGESIWEVGRYEDALPLLKDSRLSKICTECLAAEDTWPMLFSLLYRDPPDHTRLRKLISKTFTPAASREWEQRIHRISVELIADFPSVGRIDFMAQFAAQLPTRVICEIMGAPKEDIARLREWTNVIATLEPIAVLPDNCRRVIDEFVAYLRNLIAQRRAHPKGDLISALVQARDANDQLSEDELVGTCSLMMVAGQETTVNLLGNGLYCLMRNAEQLNQLRADPGLVERAVEEVLRFESPAQYSTFRKVKEAFSFAGADFIPGQEVRVWIGAANRDPTQFPQADVFDMRREPNKHLAFGTGIHTCIGGPLARLEARIAFTELLKAIKSFTLVEPPSWIANTFIRGLRALQVEIVKAA